MNETGPGRDTTVEDALRGAEQRCAAANPKRLARHRTATAHLPGGNTRSHMYSSPFPPTIARGEGAGRHDPDGHAGVDFLGEHTAGIFGHSHPRIRAAMIETLDAGILSRRGLSALCPPLDDADADRFVDAVDDCCAICQPLLRDEGA